MSFLKDVHSLSESLRKKILVAAVSVSMVLVSMVWFYSTKSKIVSNSGMNTGTDQQTEEVKNSVKDNFNDLKLQGSMYKSLLDDTFNKTKEPFSVPEDNKNEVELDLEKEVVSDTNNPETNLDKGGFEESAVYDKNNRNGLPVSEDAEIGQDL